MSSATSRTTPGKRVQRSASLSNNAPTQILPSRSNPPSQNMRNVLPASQDTVQHQRARSTGPAPDIPTPGPHRTQLKNSTNNNNNWDRPQEARSSMCESAIGAGDVSISSWTSEFNKVTLPNKEETLTPDPTKSLAPFERHAVGLLSSSKLYTDAGSNYKNVEQVNSKRHAIYIEDPAELHWLHGYILPGITNIREEEDNQRYVDYIESCGGSGNKNVSPATATSMASVTPMQLRDYATPASVAHFQPLSPAQGSIEGSRLLLNNPTINITTLRHDEHRGFATLAKNATISAIWDAHGRWKTPEVIEGTHDDIALHSILEWAEKVCNKKDGTVALLQCPHPGRAAAISQRIALHSLRYTPDIVTATFFVEPSRARGDITRQIIPTLAYQICKGIPEARFYLPVEDEGVYGRAAMFQLEELIAGPLGAARANPFPNGKMKDVLIIIDGIDQMSLDWAAHLLELLVEYIQLDRLPSVKVLVTTSGQHSRLEALLSPLTVKFISKAVVHI